MAKKIVIDVGHALGMPGNKTPDGIDEWYLNNKVALEVTKQLSEYEVEIIRVDDVTGKKDITLYERVQRINKAMPDLMISIHHNGYTGKWGNHTGVEAYYNLNRKNDTEKTIATEIASKMSTNTGLKNRGTKTAAFYVLTCHRDIIAILTEGGFMDSTIDHKIITTKDGQNAYATAISSTLIKQLKLTKKKTEKPKEESSKASDTTSGTRVGDRYYLRVSTPGYYTANDAFGMRNRRVMVTAGEYYIYNLSNGMINVTKKKGVPGSWINPNQVVKNPSNSSVVLGKKIGDKYELLIKTPGYYTSDDALSKRNAKVTVIPGQYFIYNIAKGMLNLTKIKGTPGSWVNLK